jgi:hypothetical protein
MTPERDHERIEELLTLQALGGLDAAERAELDEALAAHDPCDTCAALREEIGDTAGRLAFALEPVPVPAALERSVMAATAGAEVAPMRRRRGASIAAVAAVIAAVAIGAAIGTTIGEPPAPSNELAALLAAPGTQVIRFEGPSGDAAIAVAADGSRSYIVGTGFEPLPDGKVYEVWAIDGKMPTSLTCVSSPDGRLDGPIGTSVAGADVVAVTVEDESCPSAPTSDPILTATTA